MNRNYENHIVQKLMIAIAFAVIKSKPPGELLEEYINKIRNKLNYQEDLFQDVSISENDFANCDNEVIEELDLVFETEGTLAIEAENNHNLHNKTVDNINCEKALNTNENAKLAREIIPTSIGCGFKHSTPISKDILEKDGTNTQTMPNSKELDKDYMDTTDSQKLVRSASIKELLDIFKDIERTNENKIFVNTSTPKNAVESTLATNSQTYINKTLTVDNESTFCSSGDKDECNKVDAQSTELYTVHGYTENFTHISQSQNTNIVVPRKFIRSKNNDGSIINKDNKYISDIISPYNDNVNSINNSKNNIEECNTTKNILNDSHTNAISGSKCKRLKTSKGIANSSDEFREIFIDITNDSNNKQPDETVNLKENLREITHKSIFSSTSLLNEIELDNTSLLSFNTTPKQSSENQINKIPIEHCEDRANANNESNSKFSIDQLIFSSTDSETQYNRNNNATSDANAKSKCKCQLSSGYETQCVSRNEKVLDRPNEDRSNQETPEEIVTFKILEELNRVKNYLNRHDIRFNDSGQSSRGSQLSGVRINEAGYCLLNFLVENPLIERTLDITEEVSRVLGEYVDRLHDDEIYPQFVEKILEKVQEIIKEIYEEDRSDDLLKKEDQINRLLLLNRSFNVTKFTIEKILPILQETHQELQKKVLLELNLVKTENLCYVLHTLEVLLKRYNATASSQTSTQLSQDDDKSLKRSTITEIWRKKWNLSKSDVSEGSFKKKCVISQTGEVLNKIIVEGMDGYSLIAFAALQCFNLLQS